MDIFWQNQSGGCNFTNFWIQFYWLRLSNSLETGDSNLKSPSATTSITADDILCKVIPKANGELLLPQAYSKPRGVTSRFYLPEIEGGGESKNDFA